MLARLRLAFVRLRLAFSYDLCISSRLVKTYACTPASCVRTPASCVWLRLMHKLAFG